MILAWLILCFFLICVQNLQYQRHCQIVLAIVILVNPQRHRPIIVVVMMPFVKHHPNVILNSPRN
jgi:hypothetical protein